MSSREPLPAGNVRGRLRAMTCAAISLVWGVITAVATAGFTTGLTALSCVVAVLAVWICLTLYIAYGWTSTTDLRRTATQVARAAPFVLVVAWVGFLFWILAGREAVFDEQPVVVAYWTALASLVPAAYAALRH